MNNKYIPAPTDTSAISIGPDLEGLIEAMARNVHEVWAEGRMRDGWRYGPVRDEEAKLHSCLVPYEDLPDSEREYDRHTAVETLKFILSKGYRILPPQ
ncbi:MAG: RyR domain-containing protein [Bacteroidales bacterium]|nr:RyR domain-containing protein [Bacteroidales bacterium]